MAEGRMAGKVVAITGGASGIGKACAVRMAREGANIAIADLNGERAAGTIAEVDGLGRRAIFVQTDTSSEQDCETFAAKAFEEFGAVHAVVAAAGVSNATYVSGEVREPGADPTASFILNKPTEYWEKVLSVNLTGVMMTDRAFARRMVDAGIPGSIVNIASGAAKIPLPGAADYCVSKAGVWMLTKVLALEVARHGVRVNAIGPGFIETPMTAAATGDEERRRRIVESTPLGRLGQPEDIANTALFLASDEASFFTGEIIFPDGGLFTG